MAIPTFAALSNWLLQYGYVAALQRNGWPTVVIDGDDLCLIACSSRTPW